MYTFQDLLGRECKRLKRTWISAAQTLHCTQVGGVFESGGDDGLKLFYSVAQFLAG